MSGWQNYGLRIVVYIAEPLPPINKAVADKPHSNIERIQIMTMEDKKIGKTLLEHSLCEQVVPDDISNQISRNESDAAKK